MRTREFVALERRLIPGFPGFAVKERLMMIKPVQHTLRGFYFDGSSFDKASFYVSAFFMPLCVPAEHIHFTFGQRVRERGGDGWNVNAPDLERILEAAMKREVPFLEKLKTANDVANALRPLARGNRNGHVNPHCYEALAYVLMQAGKKAEAVDVVNRLLSQSRSTPWEEEIAVRAQLMKEKVQKNIENACEQLAAWEAETVRRLGFEEAP